MELRFGRNAAGLVVGGRELRATVFNENEVRAAAGVTFLIAAVAVSFAAFERQYLPLRIASAFLLVEFVLRTTLGLRYSPAGVLARQLTRGQKPEWVSAKPKRFSWTIGLAMASSMIVMTNVGIRGALPLTMCAICMALMWMECALGLCLGVQDLRLARASRIQEPRRRDRALRRRRLRAADACRRPCHSARPGHLNACAASSPISVRRVSLERIARSRCIADPRAFLAPLAARTAGVAHLGDQVRRSREGHSAAV
jgi:hypothetical protein